jgi:hypothetical protein
MASQKNALESADAGQGTTAPDRRDAEADSYRSARADRERTRAEREALELAALRGELIRVRDAEAMAFTQGRITRDLVQQVPPRLAAELHALVLASLPETQREAVGRELRLDVVEKCLDDSRREALAEAAKLIREAQVDDDDGEA